MRLAKRPSAQFVNSLYKNNPHASEIATALLEVKEGYQPNEPPSCHAQQDKPSIFFPQSTQCKKTKKLSQQATYKDKCCLNESPYVAAPVTEQGDIIVRTPPYAQLPSDAPTRTRFFFGSRVTVSQETHLVEVLAPMSLLYKVSTCKSSTIKGLLYAARAVPSKDYSMHLTLKNTKKGC